MQTHLKKREEDMTQEDAEDMVHIESRHTKTDDSIRDVKNISLSCEKKISEFKVILMNRGGEIMSHKLPQDDENVC